jgi:hypothetical protein
MTQAAVTGLAIFWAEVVVYGLVRAPQTLTVFQPGYFSALKTAIQFHLHQSDSQLPQGEA